MHFHKIKHFFVLIADFSKDNEFHLSHFHEFIKLSVANSFDPVFVITFCCLITVINVYLTEPSYH